MPFFLIERMCPHAGNKNFNIGAPIKVRVGRGKENTNCPDAPCIYKVGKREVNRIRGKFGLSQGRENAEYFVCDHMGALV